jgi:DNA-binding response OmpR family regulator
VLSLSDDLEFDKRLRTAALQRGQIVIRVESVESALRIIHTECSGVILLDLDFAGKAAWKLAGGLLAEPKCPPVILLTGQGEQFDLRMAVMAGSVFEKSGDADQVLNIVGELLEASLAEEVRQFIAQRGIIERLKPISEPAPLVPAQRFWGINE